MKRHRLTPLCALLFSTAAIVAIASCEHAISSPPESPPLPPPVDAATCQESCSVFDNGHPFRLAHELPDSMGASVELATFTLHGGEGARISLLLRLHGIVLSEAEQAIPIIVDAGGQTRKLSLGDLTTERLAYEFQAPGDVGIRYAIPRGLPDYDLDSLSLEQHESGATVVATDSRWVSHFPVIAFSGSCTVNVQNFSGCGASGSINPFAVTYIAMGVGGLWTSAVGNGPSSAITLAFSQPVTGVTVTIADPDFVGNTINGTDVNGHFVSIPFRGDGLPGHSSYDTQTIPGIFRNVTLTPAAQDYVAYVDLRYTVTGGAPPTDSLLITPTSVSRLEGQSVKFTAKSAKGGAVTITSWRWNGPLTGVTHSPANCGTSKDCTFKIYESGTITAIGSIAGVGNSQASATVTIAACAADADLDRNIASRAVRAEMFNVVDTVGGKEGGGFFFYDFVTHTDTVMVLPNVDTEACHRYTPDMNIFNQNNPPRYGLVKDAVEFHTHPWHAGAIVPASCLPNSKALPGASEADWQKAHLNGDIGYIADVDSSLWRFNSQWEPNPLHQSLYIRQSDANGLSSCVNQFIY